MTIDASPTITATFIMQHPSRLFFSRLLLVPCCGAAGALIPAIILDLAPRISAYLSAQPLATRTWTDLFDGRWIGILCAFAASSLIWQCYRRGAEKKRIRSEGLVEGMQMERKRIARELHDTLIQSVHCIILELHSSISRLPTSDRLRIEVESVLDRAEQVIDEVRDQVSGMRANTLSLNVSDAISDSANFLPCATSNQFQLSVFGSPQPLHPLAGEHIFAIAREALANAFAHAGATLVAVEVEYQTTGIRVSVHDDGRGMKSMRCAQEGRSRHFGLQGMSERATQINARLDIQTRDNDGTRITLSVPASSAYLTAATRGRWPGKIKEVFGFVSSIMRPFDDRKWRTH